MWMGIFLFAKWNRICLKSLQLLNYKSIKKKKRNFLLIHFMFVPLHRRTFILSDVYFFFFGASLTMMYPWPCLKTNYYVIWRNFLHLFLLWYYIWWCISQLKKFDFFSHNNSLCFCNKIQKKNPILLETKLCRKSSASIFDEIIN